MAFVKQTLSPFSTRAADPLFEFEEPYIQYGVISGQSYTANQVSYGLPKPSYLQIAESSNTVTVVGSADSPIRMIFALGVHDANTGGEVGAWRSFTGKSAANSTVTVSVTGKAWIYAEVNENGQPSNLNAWTIDYASESSVGRTYTTSRTEPISPANGDVWFDVVNNKLFKYSTDSASWEYKKRVYLGEAGVGDNGYLYSIQSWYPNRGYADYEDSNYIYYENPWRHYDGVSFTTNGQYTAIEAANWANNATIGQAVAGNQTAMNAIANSAGAMDNIAQAANTMNAFANSLLAVQALEANTSAIDYITASSLATEALVSNTTTFSYIVNNATYMTQYSTSNSGGLQFIANSAVAQGLIVNGTQNTLFRNAIANNASGLSLLNVGTAGNILHDLIGTNSSYQTLIANSQGQLLSLANSASGPIFAIGGNTVTEIEDGGICYRVHDFTATGNFGICSTGAGTSCNTVDVFLIGGGGGGQSPNDYGAGGGGGALRDTAFKVNPGSCVVTVGGAASNTCFAGLVAWYGGSGHPGPSPVKNGGSGAGGGAQSGVAGLALQPTQPQPACASPNLVQYGCGSPAVVGQPNTTAGGGGTFSMGCVANTSLHPVADTARGGDGVSISITGTAVRYGGGGGYGELSTGNPAYADISGLGGLGGGGFGMSGCNGGITPSSPRANCPAIPSACFDSERNYPLNPTPSVCLKPLLINGLANRGGGGGGTGHTGIPPYPSVSGGLGGSGRTIIRYRIKP